MSYRYSLANRTSVRIALAIVLITSSLAFAQLPGTAGVPQYAPPFDMIGFIQKATLNSSSQAGNPNPSARTRGGFLWVNNHKITVPDNTVLQMPAAALTWADLFDANIGPQTANGTETGLALADSASTRLYGTFEVHVQGNIVNGEYIAGLIFISQQSLNTGQGFVTRIDYAQGDLYVAGAQGGPEARVQINDPDGRYGKVHSPDARFTIDPDNPTIHAETGYPMCVPRTDPAVQADPLCPEINRPKGSGGGYLMNYTMPDPAIRGASDPDARVTAPFEVGDYITYTGVLMPTTPGSRPDPDQPNSYYISAYNIVANVGLYTAPFSDPVYVTIEEILQGTGGVPNPDFPQETTSRVRLIGFATDTTRSASIFARDTDCSGIITDRPGGWVQGMPVDPGPPVGAKRGRIKFQPNGGPFLPPAREVHLMIDGANSATPTANGLFPGQYFAPEFGFIFAENLGIGDPPVSLNLRDFEFLTDGIGPFGDKSTVVGPLIPFPDLNTPAATCTYDGTAANAIPTGDAGPAITLQSASGSTSAIGQLSGSGSGPAGASLSYKWQVVTAPANAPALVFTPSMQTDKPTVSVADTSGVTSPITYQLSLTVFYTSGSGLQQSTPSLTTVTVLPAATPPTMTTPLTLSPSPTVIAGGTVNATAAATFNPPAGSTASNVLTYVFTPSSGSAVTVQKASGTSVAVPFVAPNTAGTFTVNLTVSDSLGNKTTVPPQSVTVVETAAPAPSVQGISASPNTVASAGVVTLTANAITNPSGLPLAFTWTVTNAANNAVYQTLTSTTGITTFKAPTVAASAASVTLRVSLSVKNTGSTTAPFVLTNGASVTVQPTPGDILTLTTAVYRQTRARLDLTVVSSQSSPSIMLTAKITYTDSTGRIKTASALMTNGGGGSYTVTFTGLPLPSSVTVTSTGGGSLTISRSQISLR
ncbi:MAG: hypothetical protein ACJ72H_12305 [Candidatus Sulfotelmatobacter sp.]